MLPSTPCGAGGGAAAAPWHHVKRPNGREQRDHPPPPANRSPDAHPLPRRLAVVGSLPRVPCGDPLSVPRPARGGAARRAAAPRWPARCGGGGEFPAAAAAGTAAPAPPPAHPTPWLSSCQEGRDVFGGAPPSHPPPFYVCIGGRRCGGGWPVPWPAALGGGGGGPHWILNGRRCASPARVWVSATPAAMRQRALIQRGGSPSSSPRPGGGPRGGTRSRSCPQTGWSRGAVAAAAGWHADAVVEGQPLNNSRQ